uniref:Uncharacterized protein LOC101242924 n=1 Tax=Phallusia mammillata TaxID=59560 RepID=A0A6F9DJA9_9ASCI|nr:uncharacterized protein LOC101242924 [Phallusia mammillata]
MTMELTNITILLLGMLCVAASMPLSPESIETTCQQKSNNPRGNIIPICNATTHHFVPKQCDNETGFCWCAEVYSGHMMAGTHQAKSDFNIDCNSHKGTKCEQNLHEVLQQLGSGNTTWIPSCDMFDGTYTPTQCNFFTGQCWCVDEMNGIKNGTEWYALNTNIDCVKTFAEDEVISQKKTEKYLGWLTALHEITELLWNDLMTMDLSRD